MAQESLGKIEKVELRKAWKHEASDFTNWLAEDENIQMLSDEIGVDIQVLQTEASVGKFNVDILAEEEGSGNKIVIENQLEATNHDHLGKIVTYASGYEARIVIWVVKEAREEHRQAIDWLNEHTDEELSFFLIQLELWQIEGSPLAPKFEIISKPNNWAKTVRQSARGGTITDVKAKQLTFWEQFKQYAEVNKARFRMRKVYPQHWTDISIGSSYAHISLTLNSFDEVIRTELYIRNNKDVFDFLKSKRHQIEKELGYEVEWMRLEGKKASRIKIEHPGLIENEEDWGKYFEWLQARTEDFQRVFGKNLKKYKK